MKPLSGKKRTRITVLGLTIMLLLAACGSSGLQVGDQAPEFSLSTASGGEVALDDYIGRQPVLLYFHMALG